LLPSLLSPLFSLL